MWVAIEEEAKVIMRTLHSMGHMTIVSDKVFGVNELVIAKSDKKLSYASGSESQKGKNKDRLDHKV